MGTLEAFAKSPGAWTVVSQQLKLNLKHLLFKFGLAQLFEWMIKIKLSS